MVRSSTKPARLPLQPERDFQAQVIKLAQYLRWRTYHSWTSIHSAAGFPDLVLVRRPRVLFVELKREDRSPTPAQQEWLDELAQCSVEVYIWRPSDWNEIERVLR